MANEVKLECYTVRIRKEKDIKNYLNLDGFLEKNDFLSCFVTYLKSFDKILLKDDYNKRTLRFDSKAFIEDETNRCISGIIESGDYDIESKIYDIDSGKKNYTKKRTDTDIKPFYFLLKAPKGHNKGILILQRLGIYGIHGVVVQHFKQYFKNKFSEIVLEFSPLVSKNLAKAFIEDGAIKEFSLRRYNLPPDIADKLGLNNHKEDILSVEFIIAARPKSYLPLNAKVKKFLSEPNTAFFDIKDLNNLGFDGSHKTSIKVRLNGNTRTIDLSETGQIRPYYDIDKDVVKNKQGHPDFESIDSIAKELMNDLYEESING